MEHDTIKGISVIIPAYNPDINDIRQILLSLINQEYRAFEVVIANDGEDFSEKIVDILGCNHEFQFNNNKAQLGLYTSIKENIQYCKYDHILVLEQDIVPLHRKSSRLLSCVT